MQHPLLQENKWEAFIPFSCVAKQIIVRRVPLDITEESLYENIEMYSPLFRERLNIINIRRFSRKVIDDSSKGTYKFVPTTTIQITFEGQVLPQSVYIYKVLFDAQIYFPQVRQCLNCFHFGHVKAHCKGKKKCPRCGNVAHETVDDCPNKNEVVCYFCKKKHLPTDKLCPHRQEQQKLLDLATQENLTLGEIKNKIKEKKKNASSTFRFSNYPQLVDDDAEYAVHTMEEVDTSTSYANIVTSPSKNKKGNVQNRLQVKKNRSDDFLLNFNSQKNSVPEDPKTPQTQKSHPTSSSSSYSHSHKGNSFKNPLTNNGNNKKEGINQNLDINYIINLLSNLSAEKLIKLMGAIELLEKTDNQDINNTMS